MDLNGLIVCRNLLDEEIFGGETDEFKISARLIERAERLGLSGNLYRTYLIYLLAHEPNLISTSIEMQGGKIGKSLREIFKRDVEILLPIL
ncbi:MAG: ATP-binding protein, partial [Selenomonadaceae bacterium]|nr:ATP-binding protein [Selenomonadaceae bacterium]